MFDELLSDRSNKKMYEYEAVLTNDVFFQLMENGEVDEEEYYSYEKRSLDFMLNIIKAEEIYAEVQVYDEDICELLKYFKGQSVIKSKWEPGHISRIIKMINDNRFGIKTLFSREELKTILMIGIREFAGIHTMVWSPDDGIVLCTNFDMNGFIYCNNESTKELMEQSAKKQSIYLYNLKDEYEIKDCITRHEFVKAAELVEGLYDDTLKVMIFNLYYDFGIQDYVGEFIEYMKKECEHVYWQEVHDLILDNPY
jgi:hypothetical protein